MTTERTGRRRARAALANLALATLAIALGLLAAEGAVRLAAPPEVIEPFPAIYRASDDPAIGYELKPGLRGYAYGATLVTNALGLRGPELEVPKPADTWRLVVVGDSVTFGYGVPGDAAFPARLEALLRERCSGPRFEVVNAGVAGWNALQELAWLRTRGLALEPDAVVLTFVRNDVGPPLAADAHGYLHWGSAERPQTRLRERTPTRALAVPFHGFLRAHSWLFRLVETRYNRLRIQLGELGGAVAETPPADTAGDDGSGYNAFTDPARVLDSYLQTRSYAAAPTWQAIERGLVRVRDELARHDASLLLAAYNMPGLFLGRLLELRDHAGVPFLGFAYYFGSGRDYATRWTLGWDAHPNAEAHALMARILYERLLAEGVLPAAAACRPFAEPVSRSWDERYRADAARFDRALDDALARIDASEVPLDAPSPRPLGLLRGGRPLLPDDEVVALLRRPDDARVLALDLWTHPTDDADLREEVALGVRVNGQVLPPRAIPAPGAATLRWPLPEKTEEPLEVEVTLRGRDGAPLAPSAQLHVVRLTRLAVVPEGRSAEP